MIQQGAYQKLQQISNLLLFDTVDIYFPPDPNSATRDSGGEIDETFPTAWAKTGSNVPCMIQGILPFRAREEAGAGQGISVSHFTIDFPLATVVDERCRVIVTAAKFNPLLVGMVLDIRAAPATTLDVTNQVTAFTRT